MLVIKATKHTAINHRELVNGSHLTTRLDLLQKAQGAYHVPLSLEVLEQQTHTVTDGMWSVSTQLPHLDWLNSRHLLHTDCKVPQGHKLQLPKWVLDNTPLLTTFLLFHFPFALLVFWHYFPKKFMAPKSFLGEDPT